MKLRHFSRDPFARATLVKMVAPMPAPWLDGSIPEVRLTAREAHQVCRAMEVKFPNPGWTVGLGETWLGRAALTNHGRGLFVLNLKWSVR